jgi:hypothetical protein
VRGDTAGLGLLVIMFMLLFVLEPLPVHAASTLIQQSSDGCFSGPCPSISVAFSSNVASGNVIAVGVAATGVSLTPATVGSISDTRGSSFTLAMTAANLQTSAYVYVATLLTGGPDTVTVNWGNPAAEGDVYIYEVSGVTTSGAGTGSGSGSGTSIFTSSVAFLSGAFLLGMTEASCVAFTAGAGFTRSPGLGTTSCSSGAQYSDPVSSPTTFPATQGQQQTWVEVSVALNPPAPIPEYPLGLPILAILMLFGYGLVRRRTRIDTA